MEKLTINHYSSTMHLNNCWAVPWGEPKTIGSTRAGLSLWYARCLGWIAGLIGLFPVAAFAGGISVSPTNLDFGNIFVGESSEISVVITNVSSATQTISLAGGAPGDPTNFGANQNCAGVTLAPGGSCQVNYVFHPASPGVKVGNTNFTVNGVGYSIEISGTGIYPIFASPLDLYFGDVQVGTSVTRVIHITNISDVPVMPGYSGGAPSNPTNFGASQNCVGVTLAPDASCQFNYEFHPPSPGLQLGSTNVTIDSMSFFITLMGNAVNDRIFMNGFE